MFNFCVKFMWSVIWVRLNNLIKCSQQFCLRYSCDLSLESGEGIITRDRFHKRLPCGEMHYEKLVWIAIKTILEPWNGSRQGARQTHTFKYGLNQCMVIPLLYAERRDTMWGNAHLWCQRNRFGMSLIFTMFLSMHVHN